MIKRLFIYWYQGFQNSPDLVKKCLESWKFYNLLWEIIEIDQNNLYKWLPDLDRIETYNISYTHYADIVRLNLLKRYGGLWVDSTTFCNKPLDEWLDDHLLSDFFCFSNPGPDRIISTWFIYSSKDNYIISKWLDKVNKFWEDNGKFMGKERNYEYFWPHYCFNESYHEDDHVKQLWDIIPKLEANGIGPHYIQEHGFSGMLTNEIEDNINSKVTPLYKLTYKEEVNNLENSTLSFLYSKIKI